MRYLSVCSGIEAASVAWQPLGWEPVAFSEIDRFASAVLAQRFPKVPNLGNMEAFRGWKIDPIDLLVGGTPCQSFSVAGLRKGLDDPRGNLALVYLGILEKYRPRWCVWENSPGVLSSSGGRDFGAFVGRLAQLGYGFAYRVLDAQYVRVESHPYAVPQRRRRVFVVGHSGGDWKRAAEVLLEPEGMRGNPPTRREARKEVTGGSGGGAASSGIAVTSTDSIPSFSWPVDIADTITAHEGRTYTHEGSQNFRMHNVVPSEPIPFDTTQITHPTNGGGHASAIANASSMRVRRLTPRECERLQGFPDDWTAVFYRGKTATNKPRYKAIGNSMAVNVVRWIGERIHTHL